MRMKWLSAYGVTVQTISRILNARCCPNAILLRKIALVLNCTTDELYYDDFE